MTWKSHCLRIARVITIIVGIDTVPVASRHVLKRVSPKTRESSRAIEAAATASFTTAIREVVGIVVDAHNHKFETQF
jgi:hypothetical protein